MKSYENEILRPAVLLALSGERDVIVHVAPVEHLTTSGRRRSAAELGKGTPDLLASLCWRRGDVHGAQWVCFELKAPPCPGSDREVPVCSACLSTDRNAPGCGRGVWKLLPRWSAGTVSAEQKAVHAAWERGGRWVWVARAPFQVTAALDVARARLRAAGLEPCAVEGR